MLLNDNKAAAIDVRLGVLGARGLATRFATTGHFDCLKKGKRVEKV